MATIKPFKGFRPTLERAAQVASPPYDVLNSDEARAMARDNPVSFLHVVKPEIDLEPGINLYANEVYAKGRENLDRLKETGVLQQDSTPCFYLYEQRMKIGATEHRQVGLVAGASVAEYQNDLIKKHELTRPDKEKDRTRHVDTLDANTGPVFLTYKASPQIDSLINELCRAKPTYDFAADDGIGHRFWVVAEDQHITALEHAFAGVPALYVADGHHRSASGTAVCEMRKAANPSHTGDEEYNYFLSVIFPHNQMYIMDYNRVVTDLNGLSEDDFLKRVAESFEVSTTDQPKPSRATEFGMFLSGKWYRLRAKPETFDANDPVASLDVAILQNNLLSPVLGIDDPRRDKRIDFVGGIRGMNELEKRVRDGATVAFAMFPTSIEQLMNIADAGKIMPPKSTWFEPKLRSGLVVRPLS